jgi:hypothetical protein
MNKPGQNKPPELARGVGQRRADREASTRAARPEAKKQPPFWDRHDSRACNFPRSPPIERMRALLDQLDTAQNAVTGPPPTRVSFSKIAELCEGAVGIPVPQTYRDLIQSYLSGTFERTLVFYLTNSAPDLSETELAGYRMSRNFLAARASAFSLDNEKEAGALVEAYLAPCWIHRAAAARWLEAKGYPVPSEWKQSGPSEEPTEVPTAKRENKPNKSGRKPKYAREQIRDFVFEKMNYHGPFDLSDPEWRVEADRMNALVESFDMAPSTAKKLMKSPLAQWQAAQAAKADN